MQDPERRLARQDAPANEGRNGAAKRIASKVSSFIRILLGALLVLGGILGFLPILGFWMLPLGLAILALDIPLAGRLMRKLMGVLEQARRAYRHWRDRS
jgi:hypothetical protein